MVSLMLEQNDNPKYPYLEKYLKHLQQNMQAARGTIREYERSVRAYFDWLIINHKFNDPIHLRRIHLTSFRDYLVNARYRTKTIERELAAIRSYLRFLVDMQVIPDTPFPAYMSGKGRPQMPQVVPTPMELFRCRQKIDMDVRSAAFCELLLSTGMRMDEVIQSRCRDLNYGDRPFDQELKKPSPYFVGSINIAQHTHTTKNRLPRKVYFSYLAGDLMRKYMARERLNPNGNDPLFSWSDSWLEGLINAVGRGVIERKLEDQVSSGNSAEVQRQRGFVDLDLEEMESGTPRFRRALAKRQEEERSLESYKRQASQPVRLKKRKLHPHALRHAFTNIMYYRNYFGDRRDEQRLRVLMGQKSLNALHVYLTKLELVTDDETWERLWIGHPSDWMDLR